MANLPKPDKPLKILTIDGGRLEASSALIILSKLLDTIARYNGVLDSKPRPCDVFDVIAGVGSGGWLALFLGRFQMDAEAALTEWYDLIDCIEPRSKFEEFRMRALQHSHFDTDILVELIDGRTEFYQIDKHMYFTPPDGTRCKHVFVSALKTDSKDSQPEYNLFRTYDCPKGSNVLEGFQNPHECKISHAFRATGVAKYFTPPWKGPIAGKGLPKCLNIHFPSPHNITELALNEMWGLYGKDVEISVILNIRPGIPNITHRIEVDQNLPSPTGDLGPVTRQPTFCFEGDAGFEEKLRRDEIDSNIKRKLRNVYPEHTPPFYWLVSAPERSAPGTAPKHYTKEYLRTPSVQAIIEEVGQRIGKGTSGIEDVLLGTL